MKYKKQIATGALAISLLVSGSTVFAATPQDLGIKNTQQTYQRQNKSDKNSKIRNKTRSNVVGTVLAVNGTGFTLEVKNLRTKAVSSIDVKTDVDTKYKKNGLETAASDLAVGAKVIVNGDLEKTTNTLVAKIVKIISNKKNL